MIVKKNSECVLFFLLYQEEKREFWSKEKVGEKRRMKRETRKKLLRRLKKVVMDRYREEGTDRYSSNRRYF